MSKQKNEFIDHLEEIAAEIGSLTSQNVNEWIAENVLHMESLNELILTYGGPSISVYLDCGVIKGHQSPFAEPVFVSCNTAVLEECLEMFRE